MYYINVYREFFMILENTGYSYQDLTIIPEVITDINSRSECKPFVSNINVDHNGMLPIFASPMSTITNENNIDIWKRNKIMPIVPRNIPGDIRCQLLHQNEWVALSLNEFKDYFIDNAVQVIPNNTYRVCVDLANGHMKSLYDTINTAKELSRNYNYTLIIMTGNIANPETYNWIAQNAEVDYIRLSIGSGANCITSTQTSIHYPIATLIDECYQIKKAINKTGEWEIKHVLNKKDKDAPYYKYNNGNAFGYKSRPMIVADGGVRGYADVIKALGLGADYVMIGSLFTGLLESAAPLNIECYNSHYKYSFKDDGTVNDGVNDILNIWGDNTEEEKRNFIHDMKEITKESYGMSTKKAQKLINPNAKTKTSEGCTKYIKVNETISQWSDNMIDYLKSAMSYTNKHTLWQFIGNVKFIKNSNCAILAVNK